MKPLADLRIIAIEQYGAGPFGSVHLADLGAEVIKIEDPATGGDIGRYVPPYQEGEDSLFFEAFNRNKLSLSLDLPTDHKTVASAKISLAAGKSGKLTFKFSKARITYLEEEAGHRFPVTVTSGAGASVSKLTLTIPGN